LQFPSGDEHDHADYWDFVYFSFRDRYDGAGLRRRYYDKTIRRTATAHGIISFVFNTALVALMVNIAAARFSGSRIGSRGWIRGKSGCYCHRPQLQTSSFLRCHCEVSHPDSRCDSRA